MLLSAAVGELMARSNISDQDFIAMFKEHGPYETSRRIGVTVRPVFDRRSRLERKYNISITGPSHGAVNLLFRPADHPQRICLNIENGVVLIGSDAHCWPGEPSLAHKCFVKFCKDLTPTAVALGQTICVTV